MRPTTTDSFIFNGTAFEVLVLGDAGCGCGNDVRCVFIYGEGHQCGHGWSGKVPDGWSLKIMNDTSPPFEMTEPFLIEVCKAVDRCRERMGPEHVTNSAGGSA